MMEASFNIFEVTDESIISIVRSETSSLEPTSVIYLQFVVENPENFISGTIGIPYASKFLPDVSIVSLISLSRGEEIPERIQLFPAEELSSKEDSEDEDTDGSTSEQRQNRGLGFSPRNQNILEVQLSGNQISTSDVIEALKKRIESKVCAKPSKFSYISLLTRLFLRHKVTPSKKMFQQKEKHIVSNKNLRYESDQY